MALDLEVRVLSDIRVAEKISTSAPGFGFQIFKYPGVANADDGFACNVANWTGAGLSTVCSTAVASYPNNSASLLRHESAA